MCLLFCVIGDGSKKHTLLQTWHEQLLQESVFFRTVPNNTLVNENSLDRR